MERKIQLDRFRQKASSHLGKKLQASTEISLISKTESELGISVPPKLISLHPYPQDRYVWDFGPKMDHLFAMPISKLSVAAYRELCQEIGVSIIAKPSRRVGSSFLHTLYPKHRRANSPLQHLNRLDVGDSSSSTNSLIQEENGKLKKEGEDLKEEVEHHSHIRQQSEKKLKRLEEKYATAERDAKRLREENTQLESKIGSLAKRINNSDARAREAMLALQKSIARSHEQDMDQAGLPNYDSEFGRSCEDLADSGSNQTPNCILIK